ncbi:putative PurR-regulated permease PerM [Abditibacterium utsteinense]|uniref:Putative PurR-regulated permease PerM n=1 Tax=Abditibacterium utsteinense TaxID=1960156 RepID=A0A2S8SXJ8_9BACT|nr:AI-2E family transporter [Abditibacterium utsteinense]PQV65532.1 putative PurR-regulated permease PerM [Abditibacterium utsteinense]
MNPSLAPNLPRPRREKPLSYSDLRRFLFLILGLGLAGIFIHALADLLVLFTVIIFMAMVLNPVVVWLEKRGLRRGLAVVTVMLSLVGTMVGVGFLVVPPLVEQVSSLVANAPTYSQKIEGQAKATLQRFPQLERALPPQYKGKNLDKLGNTLGKNAGPQIVGWLKNIGPNFGNRVLTASFAFLGGVFTFVIALLLLAFILGNPQPLVVGFLSIIPARHREATGRSIARIESQMVAWMRATLINGVLTGVSTAALLYFIGIPSAIVFGVLSFFGEFVPNIGPIVASVPALFVSAGMGTNKFLLTGAAILFVQQVESNVLVPFIMGRELELHPVTIVFFALSMGALFGIAGAVLAVPLAAITKVLVDEFLIKPNAVPTEELEKHADHLISEREWDLPEAAPENTPEAALEAVEKA